MIDPVQVELIQAIMRRLELIGERLRGLLLRKRVLLRQGSLRLGLIGLRRFGSSSIRELLRRLLILKLVVHGSVVIHPFEPLLLLDLIVVGLIDPLLLLNSLLLLRFLRPLRLELLRLLQLRVGFLGRLLLLEPLLFQPLRLYAIGVLLLLDLVLPLLVETIGLLLLRISELLLLIGLSLDPLLPISLLLLQPIIGDLLQLRLVGLNRVQSLVEQLLLLLGRCLVELLEQVGLRQLRVDQSHLPLRQQLLAQDVRIQRILLVGEGRLLTERPLLRGGVEQVRGSNRVTRRVGLRQLGLRSGCGLLGLGSFGLRLIERRLCDLRLRDCRRRRRNWPREVDRRDGADWTDCHDDFPLTQDVTPQKRCDKRLNHNASRGISRRCFAAISGSEAFRAVSKPGVRAAPPMAA